MTRTFKLLLIIIANQIILLLSFVMSCIPQIIILNQNHYQKLYATIRVLGNPVGLNKFKTTLLCIRLLTSALATFHQNLIVIIQNNLL